MDVPSRVEHSTSSYALHFDPVMSSSEEPALFMENTEYTDVFPCLRLSPSTDSRKIRYLLNAQSLLRLARQRSKANRNTGHKAKLVPCAGSLVPGTVVVVAAALAVVVIVVIVVVVIVIVLVVVINVIYYCYYHYV